MKIAVIGGGAAGMMAALEARKQNAEVTIYEKNDRVGKKLLMTGNGKCNFSNLDFSETYFNSESCPDKKVFFDVFGVEQTLDFFKEKGMLVKVRNGYLYPASEQASVLLDILRFSSDRAGIRTKVQSEVRKIKKNGTTFIVETKEEKQSFDKVILACGSKAGPGTLTSGSGYLFAKSFGHTIIEPVPALVQLRCMEPFFKQIAGVRAESELTLLPEGEKMRKERGELQLTDYGISGIPVFQFSRYAAKALKEKKKVFVTLDFLPDFSKEEYEAFIHKRFERKKGQSAEEFFLGMVNKKIILLLIKQAGLKPEEKIEESNRQKWEKVFALLKELRVQVKETNPFENAQVSAGGVSMEQITAGLESKIVPGLFFAGELLDIDGRCGGYNLQWAWTSGYIAGRNAAAAEQKGGKGREI